MKILMLTPYLPYPLYSGGQTRSFNLIKNLSKRHEITLFSFIRSEKEKRHIDKLSPYCKKIKVFKRRPAWSPINILLAGITPYPFLVVIYLSRTLRKALTYELENNSYDLIHAETFYVMPNIPKTKVPILLVEQTIEYQVYHHFTNNQKNILLKPFLWADVTKVKFWEIFFWSKAKRVVAVSEDDKNKMLELTPKLSVEVVPNGVDTDFFSIKKTQRNILSQPMILYVGNFKWLQNREAVEILVKKIWPRILLKLPMSKLWIVGRSVANLKKMASQSIVFDESVKNIRNAYENADLMVAPIAGPGGTRLKVLEAMAAGCPVVTTPVGIEGIGAQNGIEVLVGDNNRELADLAIKILKDSQLKNRLILAARMFIAKKYNWEIITTKLEEIYKDLCYAR